MNKKLPPKRYEYLFRPVVFLKGRHGITEAVQWRDTPHRTWECLAYKVIDHLHKRTLKEMPCSTT